MADKRIAQIAGHLNFPKGLLAGQVAIITGSGQGIGAEAARLFANEGAKVVVQDIDAGESSFSCTHHVLLPASERGEEKMYLAVVGRFHWKEALAQRQRADSTTCIKAKRRR